MPNGSHAFFRFYDPNFSIEVATMSDDEQRSLIMGPCHQWLSKQREATNTKPTQVGSDKSFPWWEVPDTVVRKLSEKDKSVLIANSVKWLRENHADLYFSLPEPAAKAKVARLVAKHQAEFGSLNSYIKNVLDKEVYR